MKNIILFSSVDWFSFRQMHHQLTDSFIKENYNILFIDNTGVRTIRISDYQRIFGRIKNFLNSIGGFKVINANLTILSPIIFPSPYSKFFLIINSFIINYYLKKWGKLFNINDSILITFLPTPLVANTVKNLNPKLCIYYCANNMSEGSEGAKKLKKHEEDFFKNSNLVFTISKKLFDISSKFNSKTYYFPPGVDFNRFSNPKKNINILKNISRPIIGYVGALSDVVDYKLLSKISSKFLNCSLVLIGPNLTKNKLIKNKENIFIMGEVDNKILPSYLLEFDIGIIPYIKNTFTDAVYSCKTSEYLSVGLPVVSTNINEIINFNHNENNVIQIANNHKEFIKAIENNFTNKKNELDILNRINVAKNNSWDTRFAKISEIINKESDRVDRLKNRKNYLLKNTINYLKSFNLVKFATYSLILYLLLFYTPFFNLVGNKLIIENPPVKSDAIVVLSGNGYATYSNPSYQKRALDAIDYFYKGYAEKIILSSGKDQVISEVELLRSILINRNIPEEKIIILEKYGKNTYENIKLVKNILEKNNYDSIIFITGPFHSLRSLLIWKKNYPEIKITPVKAIDSPLKNNKLRKFNEVYTICYEYLAIAYNRLKNRL